jgi:hypothetical protein
VTTELNIVERAAVLRACRAQREMYKITIERLTNDAKRGDTLADAHARTMAAELVILEAAIRKYWQSMGPQLQDMPPDMGPDEMASNGRPTGKPPPTK